MASTRGENQPVPLSVLLKRESVNEKVENPDIIHGQANHSKKGEDFTLIKTECQRALGDEVITYHVFGVCFGHYFRFVQTFYAGCSLRRHILLYLSCVECVNISFRHLMSLSVE